MLQKQSKQITFHTRFRIDEISDRILDDCANLFSTLERKLFADLNSGKKINDLKSEYIKKYQITARQFNSCKVQLEGKILSYKELLSLDIIKTKKKIKSLKKYISNCEKKKKYKLVIHQKKRRLFNLTNKLKKLEQDKKNNKVRICFGSKKLFNSQFHLEKNGYINHEHWLKDWQTSRRSSFFVVGSKDETSGNQTCQIEEKEGKFSLQLRLPNIFSDKTITIPDLNFPYGKEDIKKAIQNNEIRKQLKHLKNDIYKNCGQAISYRLKKDHKSWTVYISFERSEPKWISREDVGVVGVDINIDHLAVVETDRFGNVQKSYKIPLCTYGKNKNQAKAIIGDASSELVKIAVTSQKPIVIEKLDFENKKQSLRELFKKYARMLSSFSYQTIISMIKQRSYRFGIKVKEVNPAYSSVIGKIKFAERYGLSNHQAAALVIGRRYMKLSEKQSSHLVEIFDGRNAHVALMLPERNRNKHEWAFWALVLKKIKTVLAAHFLTIKNRSLSTRNSTLATENSS